MHFNDNQKRFINVLLEIILPLPIHSPVIPKRRVVFIGNLLFNSKSPRYHKS